MFPSTPRVTTQNVSGCGQIPVLDKNGSLVVIRMCLKYSMSVCVTAAGLCSEGPPRRLHLDIQIISITSGLTQKLPK